MNDTFGHDAGDQALHAFSGVLRDSVRPNDIVARYGGEEFVIVFPDCGAEAAARVLERVREHLALTLSAGRVPAFTVTFGVASTEHAADFDEIVTIADHALLDAKLPAATGFASPICLRRSAPEPASYASCLQVEPPWQNQRRFARSTKS